MAPHSAENERKKVRAAGRIARAELVGAERVHAEAHLVAHLQCLDALRSPVVGVFVAHDGEPDLTPLIEWLWQRDQVVALPVLQDNADDFSMTFVPWKPGDSLVPGRYGIPVPPVAESTEAVIPDTLLVSLVGFDRHGNRIGRGGGFFDRYLADYSDAVVGVGFEAQRFDLVPTEAHDMRVPVMATDLGVRFLGS